jgi:hypothetical protein
MRTGDVLGAPTCADSTCRTLPSLRAFADGTEFPI